MEKELNIKDGYKWDDTQDYRIISKCGEKALTINYKRQLSFSRNVLFKPTISIV